MHLPITLNTPPQWKIDRLKWRWDALDKCFKFVQWTAFNGILLVAYQKTGSKVFGFVGAALSTFQWLILVDLIEIFLISTMIADGAIKLKGPPRLMFLYAAALVISLGGIVMTRFAITNVIDAFVEAAGK